MMLAPLLLLFLQAATSTAPQTIPEMWDAWCARCHAADGSGKVTTPTITVEPMDFSDCKVASPEPDADWQMAIAQGGPAVGLSSEMPAFGDSLSEEQVRAFVTYIRGLCREPGWPHGNLNLPRPIFTEKAFPENEITLLPRFTRRRRAGLSAEARDASAGAEAGGEHKVDIDLVGVYERRFGKRGMWEVAVPIASHATTGVARRQGIGDVEIAGKYVLHVDAARARIVSAGLEVSLPTGSEGRALGHGTTVFEPYLAAGAIVRDTYVQAQLKVELPLDRARADRALVYNVYAGRDTSPFPDTWTLGFEFNGENDELAVTPQLRKGLTKTGALGASLGVRLPLTSRQQQGTAVVGYLLWEYLEPVRSRP